MDKFKIFAEDIGGHGYAHKHVRVGGERGRGRERGGDCII